MTEPLRLQGRLKEAFRLDRNAAGISNETDTASPSGAKPTGDETGFDHRLPARRMISDVAAGEDRMLRYWLAGGTFLAIGAAIAAGSGREMIVLSILLGVIGALAIGYGLLQGLGGSVRMRAGERQTGAAQPADARPRDSDSAAMLSAIHDALGDIAVRRSLAGIILDANNTFRDLVGDPSPEGKTCQELGIQFLPGLVQHSYDVEIRSTAGNRVFLWHDVVARDPVIGDLVIQSIARDVTDERRMAESQEAARRRAELDSENKSRLIATVAHEIRTPLSGLLGMGNLLAQTDLAPDQGNYLAGIRQSGTALIHLVEDLLDFSTLAAGRFTLRPKPEAIRPLIETIAEMLAPRAHEKNIEIGTAIDAGLPDELVLDAARFRQVLYNVAGNAVKFTETGGILISARLEGSDLIIDVADTGPGMNESELARIFNEFEQGDLAGAREMGVGLGLAISARIVSEAGGKLSVTSEVGRGTVFHLRLPVGIDGRTRKAATTLSQSRVLLVAPDGPAANGLMATLEGLGARAGHATDPAAIKRAFLSLNPTDIIVDHRSQTALDAAFPDPVQTFGEAGERRCRRILMVDPESRPKAMTGSKHDAWLIRPLREKSLVDVLLGRFSGLEHRPDDDQAFPSLPAEREELHPSAPVRRVGYQVLIGEDDPVNALITQSAIERSGHRTRLAGDFPALRRALTDRARPDLVITDFSMPGGRGDIFLAELRENERTAGLPAIPVIVLTADTSDETRRKLLAAGANLVLAKPAEPRILAGAIGHLCAPSDPTG